MFNCPVCKRRFVRLTCLQNHKKVHRNYYQAKNDIDTSTDEKVEDITDTSDDEKVEEVTDTDIDKNIEDVTYISTNENAESVTDIKKVEDVTDTSADEKVEEVTDTDTDEKVEEVTYINTNENSEDVTDISMNEDVNIHSFDTDKKVEGVNYTNIDEKTKSITDTSIDEDVNIYSFDKLEIMNIIDDQDIFDQNIMHETNQISEESENIQEAANEFWNDSSYCSDTNKVFPHEAYQDFVEMVIKYQLSFMAGDAILKFVKKYSQIPKKALPRSTKEGLSFLDTLKKNHTEFFSIPVAEIKDQVYSFEYQ
ncbi:27845_t:CDS:2 [Dentiscutata erythropus]|uniref:27845_t:CDS:1 n=1 Tax=Dentiscutata erythropus TaxID=1348616 RepID=A0A9N9DYN1_9GLOM|nr:27845_t:CDS:2 [Dentiscutata erythropus]